MPDLGSPHRLKEHLPRLEAEHYRGQAFVFWTHTIEDRRAGWLDSERHHAFREIMLHVATREHLLCPIYTLMPDHFHLVWCGCASASDQRSASLFLRQHFAPQIAPYAFQHQPHDRVLRDNERERLAFSATCDYIADNPVRKELVIRPGDWPYTGCIVPGYPNLHPLVGDFWEIFWRVFNAAVERGHFGKI